MTQTEKKQVLFSFCYFVSLLYFDVSVVLLPLDIFTMCLFFYNVCFLFWIVYLMLSSSHVVIFLSDNVNVTGLNVKIRTLCRNNKNVYLPLDFIFVFI